MSKKINIIFILPSLRAGGAERVMTFVASNLNSKIFHCELLIVGYKGDAVYQTDILVHYLNKKRVRSGIYDIFKFIRNHNPDIVVGSIGHVNHILGVFSFLFKHVRFIGREASVISVISKYNSIKKIKYWKLYKNYYKNLDTVICQSQDMADDLAAIYKLPIQKISIINNPITNEFPLNKTEKSSSEIVKFITVGRLSKEKGHLRILKILSKLKFQFHYTIIGNGPLKDEIFNTINEYNLNEKITYIPFTKEVSKYMSLNDLFLQGSYVEGFPNTVLECCYAGTPVIAFNVPGGTKEIIIHKVNGYLVETEEDYLYYLNNRLNLSPKEIRSSVETRFNNQKIIAQYEKLFN